MRFAHLTGRERPLAVVDGDRVAPLAMDGVATVDDLIATGPAASLDAIFGYTAANDVSARDLQFATSSGCARRASTPSVRSAR